METMTHDGLPALYARLDELRGLHDGWLDGRGLAPAEHVLRWLAVWAERWLAPGLPLPRVYPTEEGGVLAEWRLGRWDVSLELDPIARSGEWYAFHLDSDEDDAQRFGLEDPASFAAIRQRLERLARPMALV